MTSRRTAQWISPFWVAARAGGMSVETKDDKQPQIVAVDIMTIRDSLQRTKGVLKLADATHV